MHTPQRRSIVAARTHHSNGNVLRVALSNLSPGYDKEQTSSLASLEARWPTKQASRNARRFVPALFVQECISMTTLVCAYGTANQTNLGPSELVGECIFYALQVRTRTIIRKMII